MDRKPIGTIVASRLRDDRASRSGCRGSHGRHRVQPSISCCTCSCRCSHWPLSDVLVVAAAYRPEVGPATLERSRRISMTFKQLFAGSLAVLAVIQTASAGQALRSNARNSGLTGRRIAVSRSRLTQPVYRTTNRPVADSQHASSSPQMHTVRCGAGDVRAVTPAAAGFAQRRHSTRLSSQSQAAPANCRCGNRANCRCSNRAHGCPCVDTLGFCPCKNCNCGQCAACQNGQCVCKNGNCPVCRNRNGCTCPKSGRCRCGRRAVTRIQVADRGFRY